jgi:RimJ/RimL family protein N-acetyltransferase
MGLSKISKINKNADLFVAIGDADYRGKGVGRLVMTWIIDYGFNKLKLHKIYLNVYEDNIPAVNLYKSLGFVVEGKIKDDVFFGGKFHNTLYMAKFYKRSKK